MHHEAIIQRTVLALHFILLPFNTSLLAHIRSLFMYLT